MLLIALYMYLKAKKIMRICIFLKDIFSSYVRLKVIKVVVYIFVNMKYNCIKYVLCYIVHIDQCMCWWTGERVVSTTVKTNGDPPSTMNKVSTLRISSSLDPE